MLKLTKKADYGLISLKHLAVKNHSASAKEIADAYGIPLPLLSKVLQKLVKNGFLISERGAIPPSGPKPALVIKEPPLPEGYRPRGSPNPT